MSQNKLPPGHKLDRLVAEHVMGLRVRSEERWEVGPVFVTGPNHNGFTGEEVVPNYSTDIAGEK